MGKEQRRGVGGFVCLFSCSVCSFSFELSAATKFVEGRKEKGILRLWEGEVAGKGKRVISEYPSPNRDKDDWTPADNRLCFLSTVSIEDIRDVRSGHKTEGMEKYAKDVPEYRCFSIVFKDQRKNLDLIASSEDDANHWVRGLGKIIAHSNSMNQKQKLQQYPLPCKVINHTQRSTCPQWVEIVD